MEIHANKIPEEEIEDVKKVVQRVQQNKFKADLADVKYLFKVYHKYIAPHDKQNVDCRACRSKVCGIFFSILRTWNKNQN
jgi:hypothetical protein